MHVHASAQRLAGGAPHRVAGTGGAARHPGPAQKLKHATSESRQFRGRGGRSRAACMPGCPKLATWATWSAVRGEANGHLVQTSMRARNAKPTCTGPTAVQAWHSSSYRNHVDGGANGKARIIAHHGHACQPAEQAHPHSRSKSQDASRQGRPIHQNIHHPVSSSIISSTRARGAPNAAALSKHVVREAAVGLEWTHG